MKNSKLEFWLEEEKASFLGWDFSYLDDRWKMDELPWSYFQMVKKHLSPKHNLLDMGTGGGEYLLNFSHPYNKTSVTEGYLPNYRLCKSRLEPLGVKVKFCDDKVLPFDDKSFDIVINRHESFKLEEVFRILKPGGYFITQQVGSMNNYKLSEFILNRPHFERKENTLSHNLKTAKEIGFLIENSDEIYAKLKFFDIGALVYYAKIIQWEFPGFSVMKHEDKLIELDRNLSENGFVESIEHRYFMVLKKP